MRTSVNSLVSTAVVSLLPFPHSIVLWLCSCIKLLLMYIITYKCYIMLTSVPYADVLPLLLLLLSLLTGEDTVSSSESNRSEDLL
jgi:hypothetical protein